MNKRVKLMQLYNNGIQEILVTARIKEFSTTVSRGNKIVPTALLVNIRNAQTNELLCDHSWIIVPYSPGVVFAKGKTIKFVALIEKYNGNQFGIGYVRKTKQQIEMLKS